jgi:very-long-chain (3R)-3-hydroxyacyl-CoA dehydratase
MCYLTDSMEGTYEAVGGAMKFCQLMQFLEIMHPLFGYTKGGVVTPLMQVTVNGSYMFQLLDL